MDKWEPGDIVRHKRSGNIVRIIARCEHPDAIRSTKCINYFVPRQKTLAREYDFVFDKNMIKCWKRSAKEGSKYFYDPNDKDLIIGNLYNWFGYEEFEKLTLLEEINAIKLKIKDEIYGA